MYNVRLICDECVQNHVTDITIPDAEEKALQNGWVKNKQNMWVCITCQNKLEWSTEEPTVVAVLNPVFDNIHITTTDNVSKMVGKLKELVVLEIPPNFDFKNPTYYDTAYWYSMIAEGNVNYKIFK